MRFFGIRPAVVFGVLMLGLTSSFVFRSWSRRFSTTGMKMSTPRSIAETSIKSNDVMVFSKTYCPYCARAKEALSELNVKYAVTELDTLGEQGAAIQAALQEMTGQRTVPNIFVKGKHIGGCDNTLAAIASGELQKMLK